ncbi:neuromedin-B isoform X2 [Coturnix japonica]|uniref:neuromedin-B isoform X2 n=1 Tax=Coturnix japonica TaxID=93934 RepID=UPI0013A5C5A4|nr:neuromedin-B isoform X2 [Coturnix japonica]
MSIDVSFCRAELADPSEPGCPGCARCFFAILVPTRCSVSPKDPIGSSLSEASGPPGSSRCHFMGKKSVPGTPQLDALGQPVVPMAFGPSLRALLEDVVELLTRELLKILLQERLLDENQGKYDLTDQETGLLTKVLEKYFSN